MENVISFDDLKYQHKCEIQEFQLVIYKLEQKIAMLEAILQAHKNPELIKF